MFCNLYYLKPEKLDIEKAFLKVNAMRKEKAEKLKRDKDKRLSLGAALLLDYVLKKNGVKNLKTGISEKGKPFLVSREVYFNVSHSGEYVICAVSDNEVGCDIEKIRKYPSALVKRFFSEKEYLELENIAQEEKRAERFTELWCEKESYLKATGEGIAGLSKKKEKCYRIFFPEISHEYKCAVCANSECQEINITEVSLKDII